MSRLSRQLSALARLASAPRSVLVRFGPATDNERSGARKPRERRARRQGAALLLAGLAHGSPIQNPTGHLVCYELGGADPFTPRRASLRDQFGVQAFDVVRPTKLCVPSRNRS
jgi:hypothetical protein